MTQSPRSLTEQVDAHRDSEAYRRFADQTYDFHHSVDTQYAQHLVAHVDDAGQLAQWGAEIMASQWRHYYQSLAANPLSSETMLRELFDDPSRGEGVTYFLARNPSLNREMVARLFVEIEAHPQPQGVVPSIAVALASRDDLTAQQVAALRAIGHPRVDQELTGSDRT